MGARARSSPGNQRRRACLPASVLVRAQVLIVRVVFLVRGCRSKHWGSRVALAWGPGTRTSHGATVRRVQLRHCMFNWTLALTRTEMHGVGICRSSKDRVKEQRLCVLFLSVFDPFSLARQHNVCTRYSRLFFFTTENKHENSNSGLRDLSYSLHNRPRRIMHVLSARRPGGGFGVRLGGRPQFR